MELIELTTVEQSLQDSGVVMTLKDIADSTGKKHSNLMRDFMKDLDSLGELIGDAQFEHREFTTKEGNVYKTVEMGLKTALWAVSRFDAKLRMIVVNKAFEKLEEEHKQLEDKTNALLLAKSKVEKELMKEKSSKLNEFNGYMSVSKLKLIMGLETGVTELLDILEDQSIVESETITKVRRVLISDVYGTVDNGKNPRFTLEEAKVLFKDVK